MQTGTILSDHITLAAEQTKTLEVNCNSLSRRLDRESNKTRSLENLLAKQTDNLKRTQEELSIVQGKFESVDEELKKLRGNNQQLDQRLNKLESQSAPNVFRDVEGLKTQLRQNDIKIKQLEKEVKEKNPFHGLEGLGFSPMSLPVGGKPARILTVLHPVKNYMKEANFFDLILVSSVCF